MMLGPEVITVRRLGHQMFGQTAINETPDLGRTRGSV
jgi:hypothetical protein